MHWLWTWSGKSFGYRVDDDLWTHDGRHVGRFDGDQVFDPGGAYLGEVINDRLTVNKSRRNLRRGSFTPFAKRMAVVKHTNLVGLVGYVGHEDFPLPEAL